MSENELNFEVLKAVPAWKFRVGDCLSLECDKNGIPLIAFYRKRLKDKDMALLQSSKTKKKSTSEDTK